LSSSQSEGGCLLPCPPVFFCPLEPPLRPLFQSPEIFSSLFISPAFPDDASFLKTFLRCPPPFRQARVRRQFRFWPGACNRDSLLALPPRPFYFADFYVGSLPLLVTNKAFTFFLFSGHSVISFAKSFLSRPRLFSLYDLMSLRASLGFLSQRYSP